MDQKSFQELVFRAAKNIVNAVVTLIASRPKSVFLQTKATHFETMMTAVNEVNTDKVKVRDEFIFRSVVLVCFTAELDE